MPIDSREKGARTERELVKIFRDAGWPLAERTSDGRVQSGRGDIAGGPAGWHVESKSGRLNLKKALDQIARDSSPLDHPLLCFRPDRHDWLGVLPLEDLLPLIRLSEL